MPKKSTLKPSGYDVVIRNRNVIRRINGKMEKLVDEKDRLLREMWKACPHDEVAHGTASFRTPSGQESRTTRFCTGCGESEFASKGPFRLLGERRGRVIKTLDEAAFSARWTQTLLWTGCDIKGH